MNQLLIPQMHTAKRKQVINKDSSKECYKNRMFYKPYRFRWTTEADLYSRVFHHGKCVSTENANAVC